MTDHRIGRSIAELDTPGLLFDLPGGVRLAGGCRRPIFQQIAHYICLLVVRGELKPGEKLPAVKEMADALGFNPNTVERACQQLERTGLLIAHRGHGINVTEDRDKLSHLREKMARQAVDTCLGELRSLGVQDGEIMDLVLRHLAEADVTSASPE